MKTLIKKEYKNLLLIITLLFLIHLPLMTKNIISADIKREPTRLIASTMITAVITAIIRL